MRIPVVDFSNGFHSSISGSEKSVQGKWFSEDLFSSLQAQSTHVFAFFVLTSSASSRLTA